MFGDLRPASDSKGGAYGPQDRQFIVSGGALSELNGHTAGVLHGWATVAGGYSVEVGIPLSSIGLTALAGVPRQRALAGVGQAP